MDQIKLDKKDLRILNSIDKNPKISINHLAKTVGVSRQVAEYRLKKLIKQNTIYNFYTLVDLGKLGYSLFRVHLRLKNVTREKYKEFARKIFTENQTHWVAFISGGFDLILDIFAKNPNDFKKILSKIVENNKEIIQSYEPLIALNLTIYEYGYFLDKRSNRKAITFNEVKDKIYLDKTDESILKIIKLNSRASFVEIGKRVGLTRNAVKNRIRKLEESGIIVGYTALVNFSHFDKNSFKIFIKYNTQKRNQEIDLLNFLKQTPGVLATLQLFGRWDLDIEIHKKNISELQKFIMELRNKFDIIEDYEIANIIEDFGIDFFPNLDK